MAVIDIFQLGKKVRFDLSNIQKALRDEIDTLREGPKRVMDNTDYSELKLLSIWQSPPQKNLAKFVRQIIGSLNNRTLYYIDATNSFPLQEFQKIIAVEQKEVYDRIRIITCLDLSELSKTLNQVVQVLNIDKIQQQQRRKEKDGENTNVEILLILNGLEIMFRNTQMECSPSESHLLLKDLLLKLRTIANNCEVGEPMLRTVLTFPKEELLKFNSSNSQSHGNKRLKSTITNANTLAEYVAKFYADEIK